MQGDRRYVACRGAAIPALGSFLCIWSYSPWCARMWTEATPNGDRWSKPPFSIALSFCSIALSFCSIALFSGIRDASSTTPNSTLPPKHRINRRSLFPSKLSISPMSTRKTLSLLFAVALAIPRSSPPHILRSGVAPSFADVAAVPRARQLGPSIAQILALPKPYPFCAGQCLPRTRTRSSIAVVASHSQCAISERVAVTPAPASTATTANTTTIGFGITFADSDIDKFEGRLLFALQGAQSFLPSKVRTLSNEVLKVIGEGRLKWLLRGQDWGIALHKMGNGIAFKLGIHYGLGAAGVIWEVAGPDYLRWQRAHFWRLVLTACAALVVVPLAAIRAGFTVDLHDVDAIESALVFTLSSLQSVLTTLRCGKVCPVILGEVSKALGRGRLKRLLAGVGLDSTVFKVGSAIAQKLGLQLAQSWAPTILRLFRVKVAPRLAPYFRRLPVPKIALGVIFASFICCVLASSNGVVDVPLATPTVTADFPPPTPPPPLPPPLPG
ncbi:hypothetical protein FB451DRAFT_483955 [Mycena latifolia]|nr:hypothetical protein FB451DRAFT_483955 [Mycena latifolia]